MHSIKKIICLANCLLVITLCGCSQAKSGAQSGYVDISEVEQNIEEGQLNINTGDFNYDDKPFNIMKLNITIDGDYFYYFTQQNKKINLQNGRMQYVCQIPGCAHDALTSPGCTSHQQFGSPIATSNGIYYTEKNKVMLLNGGSSVKVLENSYYTDYEKEIYPDNKSGLTALVIKDNLMYIVGPTYFFTYNLDTQETSEPEIISETFCMAFCVGDGYLYYSSDNLELYLYNIEKKTSQKLDDKVGQVCAKNEKVYYIKYENEIPFLYSAKADGSDPTKLIEDCYVNYYITENSIYYQEFITKEIYKCGLDGKNPEKINLHNKELDEGEYIPSTYMLIASTGSMDHVFIMDVEGNIIYIFEDDSTEFRKIKIGEE